MRVTRDLPEFKPITLVVESEEELAALMLSLGQVTVGDLEKSLTNPYYDNFRVGLSGLNEGNFSKIVSGITSAIKSVTNDRTK